MTAIRPTAQSLAEFYFKKVPIKTGWLRPDSLAVLLSLANISAHSRTLVVDGTGGLIAGNIWWLIENVKVLSELASEKESDDGYCPVTQPNTTEDSHSSQLVEDLSAWG